MGRVETVPHDVDQHLLQGLVWELELGPRRPQMPLVAWAQQCQLPLQMLQHSLSNLMTGSGPQRAGWGTWQPIVLCCVNLGCRLMLMTGSTCSPEAGRAVALTCPAQGWQLWLAHALACNCTPPPAWGQLGTPCMAVLPRTVVRSSRHPLFVTARHWNAQHLGPNHCVPLQAHPALS